MEVFTFQLRHSGQFVYGIKSPRGLIFRWCYRNEGRARRVAETLAKNGAGQKPLDIQNNWLPSTNDVMISTSDHKFPSI